MFSKFSVKKPLTVLVAVILVIVLGVVSYLDMTPSLFPSMELPYVIIVTTYILNSQWQRLITSKRFRQALPKIIPWL